MEKVGFQRDEVVLNEILDAGKELFRRYGYKKTSMEDIAKSLGKGKSTLYYYYKSKGEIFEEIVRRENQELHKRIRLGIDLSKNLYQQLTYFAHVWFLTVQEKAEFYAVMRDEVINTPYILGTLKEAYRRESFPQLRDIFMSSISKGEIRMVSSDELDSYIEMLIAMLWCAKFPIFIGHEVEGVEKQIDVMIKFSLVTFNK